METKFKVGDTVWGIVDLEVHKGEIVNIDSGFSITVKYNARRVISYGGKYIKKALSFTPFTIELKGFTSERPQPVIEKDTLVWVRRDIGVGNWEVRYYSRFENGKHYCFNDQKKSTESTMTVSWEELSLTNPLQP